MSSEIKINPVLKKIRITEINGYNMFGEWTEAGCHISLGNINHVGNEAKDDPSRDFSTVSGTGTGHVA
jgi:hypothetical protein